MLIEVLIAISVFLLWMSFIGKFAKLGNWIINKLSSPFKQEEFKKNEDVNKKGDL